MNNLDKLYENHKDITNYSKAYFGYVSDLLKGFDHSQVADFMAELERARQDGNTIFVIGNGGSASTASHMGADLGAAVFKSDVPKPPFRIQSLADYIPMLTATGNDFGYEHVFTKQLEILYRKGDLVIIISASGNSANVVNAAEWVHKRGGKVLGMLGFDGGKLKSMCDIALVVETPKGEYGPVEDTHLILNHMLVSWMHFNFAQNNES